MPAPDSMPVSTAAKVRALRTKAAGGWPGLARSRSPDAPSSGLGLAGREGVPPAATGHGEHAGQRASTASASASASAVRMVPVAG